MFPYVGGAAVTDIFVLGHDPHVSLTTSRTLAQKAFKPHWLRKLPLPLRLLFFLNSCLKDEMYDSKKFEFVLKQHYGTKLRSFDVAKPSGIKIGLTTVATETNIPVLITNYRTILGCEGNYGEFLSFGASATFVIIGDSSRIHPPMCRRTNKRATSMAEVVSKVLFSLVLHVN